MQFLTSENFTVTIYNWQYFFQKKIAELRMAFVLSVINKTTFKIKTKRLQAGTIPA